MEGNYFKTLFDTNVSDKIEKKNGLSYVSWSYAWAEVKKLFPDSTYTVYENRDGWNYHTDGRTCWVKTGMTVNGIEHIEMLPVMDFKNRAIPLNAVTSMDVNKAIQRSLTKAAARHGLGLYVYAGEDLPECESEAADKPVEKPIERVEPKAQAEVRATIPAAQKPVLSPEMKHLSNELAFLAQEQDTTMDSIKVAFEINRKAAIKQKLVPDKKIGEYTLDEINKVLDFLRKNLGGAA